MADILHDLWIKKDRKSVFRAICQQPGLDYWWTLSSEGKPIVDSEYQLVFGCGYDWKAKVTKCEIPAIFEWTMTEADEDWKGSKIGFELTMDGPFTKVSFYHKGWPTINDHYKRSSYCWAMYLRGLKRYLEDGEIVPYSIRTSV